MTVPPDPHLVDDVDAETKTTTDAAADAGTEQPAPDDRPPEA